MPKSSTTTYVRLLCVTSGFAHVNYVGFIMNIYHEKTIAQVLFKALTVLPIITIFGVDFNM
jgi:hypothetical protein